MQQPETSDHQFVVGRNYRSIRGDITVLDAIAGQPPAAIERRLGYHAGRLAKGYSLLRMVEKVGPDDFTWGDQTRYSGGRQLYRDAGAMVPRRDLLRGELLVRHGSDAAADAELYRIFGDSLRRINDGVGKGLIIKVFPNIPHNAAMPSHVQYPDADVRNIPQWTLVHGKAMACIANVHAGAVFGGRL
ncbi:hypothetical protein [Sandarakinorhabdus sp. DWP1-3-1]|uniref:hypothetical protein n=1 Tax=Sandarakinorhabdus sp. DWP1-3-1 TaxID=2804627 RepID=UPI003CE68639